MAVNQPAYERIRKEFDAKNVTLVAVSKTKPVKEILELYNMGHRDFGENYVQELVEKSRQLPADIRWHFIGHLQTNKVKLIAPFVQLIHGADSLKLLEAINRQGEKTGRVIDCLLQVHIASEETKFGLDEQELDQLIGEFAGRKLDHTAIRGLMGMASFTPDMETVRKEFRHLKGLFDNYAQFTRGKSGNLEFKILSMGMSADYRVAIEEGSNMVRIGSLLFGERANK